MMHHTDPLRVVVADDEPIAAAALADELRRLGCEVVAIARSGAAAGYYLWLHTSARAWMLRERMHRMETRLSGAAFVRVHRSALVRSAAIMSLEANGDVEPSVLLRSGARLRVARDRVAEVRDQLLP
jgi:CheY-like chemotaxis protein